MSTVLGSTDDNFLTCISTFFFSLSIFQGWRNRRFVLGSWSSCCSFRFRVRNTSASNVLFPECSSAMAGIYCGIALSMNRINDNNYFSPRLLMEATGNELKLGFGIMWTIVVGILSSTQAPMEFWVWKTWMVCRSRSSWRSAAVKFLCRRSSIKLPLNRKRNLALFSLASIIHMPHWKKSNATLPTAKTSALRSITFHGIDKTSLPAILMLALCRNSPNEFHNCQHCRLSRDFCFESLRSSVFSARGQMSSHAFANGDDVNESVRVRRHELSWRL